MSYELKLFLVISTVFLLLFSSLLMFILIYVRRQLKHRTEIEEIRRKNEASLLKSTLTAQENERERIGANLHDDIGPLLSSVKIYFKHELNKANEAEKEDINTFLEALDENIEQVRDISRDMVPNVLKNFGLKAAIEEIIRRFSKDNQITFNLQINKDVKIPKEKELPIYRIIQECINNAIRHGRSNKIQIEVLKKNGFTVKIADDGIGFDQLLLKHGLGLRNIEARAKSIDAVLNVESQVGKGTNIIITSL